MITAKCGCGWQWVTEESAHAASTQCPQCGKTLFIACAEELPEQAGEGDFDAILRVVDGPACRDHQFFLGGCATIEIGKLEDKCIRLPGPKVSRFHCKLERLDFGPSRWKLVDNKSTNGLFVNGQTVSEKELDDGDLITIGDFDLEFSHIQSQGAVGDFGALEAAAAEGAALAVAEERTAVVMPKVRNPDAGKGGGPICPSCDCETRAGAKICVRCGIYLPSGRPVLTAGAVDENFLYANTESAVWLASWIMPLTLMPIPVSSEAYGTKKPYAIWGIAAATFLASLLFFLTSLGGRGWDIPGRDYMLWPDNPKPARAAATPADSAADLPWLKVPTDAIDPDDRMSAQEIREGLEELSKEGRRKFDIARRHLRGKVPDGDLDQRAYEAALLAEIADAFDDGSPSRRLGTPGTFAPSQLITHAFLHDWTSILGFILHLGGNLMFMLVLGSRVNALIGNIATLILYPILAVGAALIHMALGNPHGPMVGASGAIMGLAGIYLILFPANRVFCAMWIRLIWWIGLIPRTAFAMKIFPMRGFWLLVIYFGFDALMVYLGWGGSTAHWAHLGGAMIGIAAAVALLCSRLMKCGGCDLLSVSLGKAAWPLIGKPSRWAE